MILNLFRYRKKSTTKCREIHFIKAETGQQSPRQRPDGDRRSDDGKPRDSVSDTVGNMAAGGLAKRFTVAWLARVISFEAFSMMVDEALERMKKMLESNKAMQTLVSGEAGEVNE